MKALLFIGVSFLGLMVGGMMASYIFFGIMTLIGFIALVENVRPLKWFIERTTSFIDVVIFLLTIAATVNLGVTITASLTVAGLGFTLLYGPFIRNRYQLNELKKK